ncbi:hypothetical protein JT358_17145 [Micrococcales bacterium 31B]|nr:hypothetical protein [Micrococcales bacterium 31B]
MSTTESRGARGAYVVKPPQDLNDTLELAPLLENHFAPTVLAYRERKRTDRRSRLDELTRQAADDGLDDVDPAVYREALAEARKS